MSERHCPNGAKGQSEKSAEVTETLSLFHRTASAAMEATTATAATTMTGAILYTTAPDTKRETERYIAQHHRKTDRQTDRQT